MRPIYKYINSGVFALATLAMLGGMTVSCDDFLDREPESKLTPDGYFSDAGQLEAYANDQYSDVLPSHTNYSYGIFGNDAGTDNQVKNAIEDRFTTDRYKVPHTEDSYWKFDRIYKINFFFDNVRPKFGTKLDGSENTISGDLQNIRHYIGEMYFLRACQYFKKLQDFGDFPIVTSSLPDDAATLRQAAKRRPRNEVARFIISDLDSAINLLGGVDMATTRINKDVALLLKSRVALFEATWEQNFKGTAFVPGGQGWPGASKDYNKGFTIDIDNEISYFLDQAIDASQQVADKYESKLTQNTGVLQQDANAAVNPYYNMFSDEDLSSYPEVLLWRQYARGLETHNVNPAASRGNYLIGMTRGFVQNFLMADGTPVYKHGNYATGDGYYKGDQTIADVRANRDSRLSIFLKEPGQKNVLYELDNTVGTDAQIDEPVPNITSGDGERGYSTGYALHKGGNFNRKYYANGGGYTAAPCYRAAEALLNYMEASYLKKGQLDSKAREYWKALRRRAGVSEDIDKTIAETDMNEEAKNDWGAYSNKKLVDKTLYNIRRERRCEFMSEGLRWMDLCRWRSMDQLIDTPYQIEGIHIWNTPMTAWYNTGEGGKSILISDGSANANVSSPSLGEYLRPFARQASQPGYSGVTFKMAHYLRPVMIKQIQLTAETAGDYSTATIYQNPYWPTTADQPATE